VLVLAMLCCAPAASATPEPLNTTGSLTYTWQASPALGCAQAYLCGTTGTIAVSILRASRPLKLYLTRPILHRINHAQVLRDLHAGRLTGGGSGGVPVM
jgi:hypothetical protein